MRTRLVATVATLVAATLVAGPTGAQGNCATLAVGCAVKWEMPPPRGASTWRAGHYSGVITEITGGMAGMKTPGTVLVDLATGKSTTVPMDRIAAVRCWPEEWRTVAALGRKVRVCRFAGAGIDGEHGVDYIGSLRVAFNREIVLSNGQKAKSFSAGYDGYFNLSMGVGPNDWAADQPPPPPPPPPPSTVEINEMGQAFAQAATVRYPAVVQATMGPQDYDTMLFDFPGGHFQARASSSLNLVIDLLDAQGKALSRSFGPGGFFDMTLPAGRYGLIVRVMNHAGTGPYELTIGPSAGATHYHERQ